MIPARRRRPAGAGRAPGSDRPQPRGPADPEAAGAARPRACSRRATPTRRSARSPATRQTKINRCLAEGRERFRRVLSRSRDGSRCEELRPLLSAFCDGEAGEPRRRRCCASTCAPVPTAAQPCAPTGRPRRRRGAGAGAAARPLAARPRPRRLRRARRPLRRRRRRRPTGPGAGRRRGRRARRRDGGAGQSGRGLRRHRRRGGRLRRDRRRAGAGWSSATSRPRPPRSSASSTRLAVAEWSEERRRHLMKRAEPAAPEPDRTQQERSRTRPPSRAGHADSVRTGPGSEQRRGRIRPARAGRDAVEQRRGVHERIGRQRGGGVRPMRAARAILLATAVVVGLSSAGSSAPAAEPWPPTVHVYEQAEDGWLPDNDFIFVWKPADSGFPIAALKYRVRDYQGAVAIPEAQMGPASPSTRFRLPAPGRYVAEVWFEGFNGERSAPQSLILRLDDVRPAPAQPQAPAGWVGGGALAQVRFEHPASMPISGIRGYAFSVDRGDASTPCVADDRCTVAETDLRVGVNDDTAVLAGLPEGANMIRAVAVSGSGLRSEARSATVWVDGTKPETSLNGAPAGWSNGPVRVTATATDALSGMAAAGPGGPFTAISLDGGVPITASGDSVSAVVSGAGVHRLSFYARDAAGNSSQAAARVAAVRIDETAPTVAFAERQDPSEPERIEAEIGDALSGPSPERGSIALRRSGSRRRFEPLATGVSAGRLVAQWDSDAFPSGTYEFRATAYDAAGNTSTTEQRVNGSRMLLVNPLKSQTRIEAGFGGRQLVWHRCHGAAGGRRCRPETIESFAERPAARTVPYGRGSRSRAAECRLGGGTGRDTGRDRRDLRRGRGTARRVSTLETGGDGTFLAPPGAGARATDRSSLPRRPPAWPQRCPGAAAGRPHRRPPTGLEPDRRDRRGADRLQRPGRRPRSAPSHRGRPVELQFRLPGGDGRRSAPSRPIRAAAFATPTPSATTTVVASASSSAPSLRPQRLALRARVFQPRFRDWTLTMKKAAPEGTACTAEVNTT